MINTPLRYPGGKHKMFPLIQKLVKDCGSSVFIEPFCGGAAIGLELLRTDTVQQLFLNDLDKSIFLLWKAILDYPEDLIHLMYQTPVTLSEWHRQKLIREDADAHTDLEIAFSTLFLNRTNRSGIIDKAGPIGGKQQNGKYKLDCRFNKDKLAKKIRLIHSLADRIQIYNLDAQEFMTCILPTVRNPFIFLDPPYYEKGNAIYTKYLGNEEHRYLSSYILDKLSNVYWILTYDNCSEIKDMYPAELSGEHSLRYTLQNKSKAIEFIAYSPKFKDLS